MAGLPSERELDGQRRMFVSQRIQEPRSQLSVTPEGSRALECPTVNGVSLN